MIIAQVFRSGLLLKLGMPRIGYLLGVFSCFCAQQLVAVAATASPMGPFARTISAPCRGEILGSMADDEVAKCSRPSCS